MKQMIFILLMVSLPASASIMGISTHPLNRQARVLRSEMTGYMSQRNEMGAGLRYTQEVAKGRLLDANVAGAQESRALTLGAGMDFELQREDVAAPRVSLKPYVQYQKFDGQSANLLGVAPALRKGFVIANQEVFPYLAVPTGLKIDSATNEFVYYASLTIGASMPFPASGTDRVLLSLEGNKNMGAASDSLGCLVSWIWN